MTGELAALGAALAWAVGFLLVRIAPASIPPTYLSAIRLLTPAVAFPALMFASGRQDQFLEMEWRNFAGLAASVITGVGVGDVLMFRAMRLVGVVRSYTIGGTFPLFGLVFAVAFLGERVGAAAVAGIILIVAGGAFVTARSSADLKVPAISNWAYRRGLALSLLVAMMWGADLVFLKIGVGDSHTVVANSFRMPFAAVVMTLAAWRIYGEIPVLRVSPFVALMLLLSGLLGLTLGSALYLGALQDIGVARSGALGAVSPVFAMLLAVAVLRERPGWKATLGTVVTAGGVALMSLR